MRQDYATELKFNLKVDHILHLREAKNNRCAACNIELLWAYHPKDTQQFSIDRLNNVIGHTHDKCTKHQFIHLLTAKMQ